MILGMDPKVDYAFKRVFGQESTRPILIDLIDKVLNSDPAHQIREIELLNPFNPKETLDDKLSILDIKARDQAGRQFNIEMQMLASHHFEKRIFYYGAKLYQQQLHEGEDYLALMPTISISFLDDVLFPLVTDHHLRFRLLEEKHHFPFVDDIEFHILELPKFANHVTELTSGLDIWLYFLRHGAKIDVDAVPLPMQQPMVLRALEELRMMKQTDLERERYESRRKAQLDYNTGLKVARLEGREEGREKGREEGREEGLIRGEVIGEIHVFERLLHRPETPTEQLDALSQEDLTRLADELQQQLAKR